MNAQEAFCSRAGCGSGSDAGQPRETHGAPPLPAMTDPCHLESLKNYFMCHGPLPGKIPSTGYR